MPLNLSSPAGGLAMSDQASAPPKATTVFLSYTRSDEAKARQLAAALESAGYEIWWDGLIEGGAAYSLSIEAALDSADAVLVLWSAKSVESDWVRDEAAQGRERHRLVPLSLDGTQPPLGFRQYQVIDLTHWHGRQDAPEVQAIERSIATVAGQKIPRRKAVAPVSRRGILVAGGAAAAVVAGGGAWLVWEETLGRPAGARDLSIAVLPFKNLSGDESQAYFSDGLTDEIRTALTRIASLRVLASTSSEAASQDMKDPKAIARELGVQFLLTGSVQRAGDDVRIATDLIDGHSGFTRWSDSSVRKLTDIFAVQSEIAGTVAQAMSVQVATSVPAPGGTRNVDAYEHFLQGRALFNLARDEETDRTALADFELAISEDPEFALAHAARSRSLAALAGEHARIDQLKPLYDEAIASARKAIALAPDLAEAHLALGFALFTGRLDLAAARPAYDRAYQLGRGNADVVLLFALYCSRAARAREAAQAVEQAVALDPLNPRAHRAEGSVAYAARRYSDALPPLRKALDLNPKMTFAHFLAGASLMGLGRLPEARKEFEAEPENEFHFSGLAIIERMLGDGAAADKAFADLIATRGDSASYQQAEVLAQWGRPDEAIKKLVRARQVGDSGLVYVATDPLLDPIRSDARFNAFVRSLRLA
jgi:TolB-like protein/tetratricopeptide (TPR) repeat protein